MEKPVLLTILSDMVLITEYAKENEELLKIIYFDKNSYIDNSIKDGKIMKNILYLIGKNNDLLIYTETPE